MKIADGLLLQQDLAQEINRLKTLAEQQGWEYRMQRGAGEKLVANFDLEENHNRVKTLSKLKRRLSRAISKANNTVDIDVNSDDYNDWL